MHVSERRPRRKSLTLGLEMLAQSRNRFSRMLPSATARAKRSSLAPNPHLASLSKFSDTIVRISEMMLTLFIPDTKLKVFVEALKSAQFCGTNAIKRNGSGDVFHSEWSAFCGTVSEYLNGDYVTRCKEYISENLDAFGVILKQLGAKIPTFGPLKRRLTAGQTEMKTELGNILAILGRAKTIEDVSELAMRIDKFAVTVTVKHSGFFEAILSDRSDRTKVLFDCSQYFEKATNCARNSGNIGEMTTDFFENLKDASEIFADLIKTRMKRADDEKRRKSMSQGYRMPLAKARSEIRYNKTDNLEVSKAEIPAKGAKDDESSQEPSKLIPIPDVSATSEAKIVHRPPPRMTSKKAHPKPSQPIRVDPRQEEQLLKAKYEDLQKKLAESKTYKEYEALQAEVTALKDVLNELKRAELNNGDIEQSIIILKELCNLENERTQKLEAELVRIQQVNDGMQTENDTVNFDNISLKKEISESNEILTRKKAQVERNRQQKDTLMNQDTGQFTVEDQRQLIDEDIRMLKRLISWTEERILVVSEREPEMNFEVRFEDDKGNRIAKLREKITKLEQSLNARKPNNMSMSITEQYETLRASISTTHEAVLNFQNMLDQMRVRIEKLTTENQRCRLKRQDFDTYETLKDTSREMQQKYFALKNQITPSMDCKERYQIQMGMDDVQDQYTSVMMEIERIIDTTSQEALRASRKDRNKARKEIMKGLSQASQVMNETIEQERKAVEKEQEVRLLIKKHGTVDERYVIQLSEWILENKKTNEVLKMIDAQTQEFNIELPGNSNGKRRIDELKETIAKLMKNGGAKMAQRIRIYNLRKEIERLT